MRENQVESQYQSMWIENDILFIVYKPGLIITKEVAELMHAERLGVSAGVTRPLMVDLRGLVSIDPSARKFFASAEALKYISGIAVFTGNSFKYYIISLAAKLFLLLDKPVIPTKLFSEIEFALAWLEPFKKKD